MLGQKKKKKENGMWIHPMRCVFKGFQLDKYLPVDDQVFCKSELDSEVLKRLWIIHLALLTISPDKKSNNSESFLKHFSDLLNGTPPWQAWD